MDSKRQYSTPTVIRKPSEGIDAMKIVYDHLATLAAPIAVQIEQCLSEIRCCQEAGDVVSVRALKKKLRRLRIDLSWYEPTKTKRAHPETE